MRHIKYYLFALLFMISSMMSALVFAGSASAATDYDRIVKPVNSLVVSDGATCTKDLSSSWESDLEGLLSQDDLESFSNRQAWAVSVWYGNGGDPTAPNTVTVQWWEPEDLPANATFWTDSLATPQGEGRYALLSVGSNECVLSAYVGSEDDYWGPAIAMYWDWETVGDGYVVRPFLAYGVNINYPIGYEGEYVPSEAPSIEEPPYKEPPAEEYPPAEEPPVEEEPYDPGPPAPITRTYTGTVDCGYKDLHGMAIVQDGVESTVTLYDRESQYRASWQHDLVVGVPYQVVVTCGGSLTYSNGSVSPEIASGDWMCKPGSTPWRSKGWLPFGLKNKPMFSIPGYCVLS